MCVQTRLLQPASGRFHGWCSRDISSGLGYVGAADVGAETRLWGRGRLGLDTGAQRKSHLLVLVQILHAPFE